MMIIVKLTRIFTAITVMERAALIGVMVAAAVKVEETLNL